MDQRMHFVAALSTCRWTMSELCRLYGISRKTGYKWATRYGQQGLDGLKDRSRRPTSCPHRTDERCEAELVEERRKHPTWGARKLLARLRRRHPDWPWPAASTATAALKRHGLVTPRKLRYRRPSPGKPTVEAAQPNDVWTADFKGEFRTGDRQMCYPLTLADHLSRYLLSCKGRRSTAHAPAIPVFEEAFRTYGLPRSILTDGGSPFSSPRSPRRLSRLSVWWIKLGIEPLLIEPGHPEQNGRHERMHRTLKAETARPPAASLTAQQAAFDGFRREYNRERPHEALGQIPPTELYARSPRPYPGRVPQVSYPGHFEVRRVKANGVIRFQGQIHFVSSALGREWVGLEEVDDGLWSVQFGSFLLGRYDERDASFEAL
ncbi:MAG TPA: IS481 family transposase [Thermoanaerobaculia bacterium]|nr:IS481 family transposase [Thermoanaerobaculia bacterium]